MTPRPSIVARVRVRLRLAVLSGYIIARSMLASRLAWLCAGASLAFALIEHLTEPRPLLAATAPVIIALSLAIAVTYWQAALDALTVERPTPADVLALGVFMTWGAAFLGRSGSILSRQFGVIPVTGDWINWTSWLLIEGALCHLLAPYVVRGRVGWRRWAMAGGVILAGLALAGVLAVLDG